jgi:RNA polymerase sigma factor (sigma-70 family)
LLIPFSQIYLDHPFWPTDNPIVATFRIEKIAELCRQMAFTPQEARVSQLAAAEELLLDVDSAKVYPAEFITFRVTGYRPRTSDAPLLTGLALQHDLGLLIEQVSHSLNLRADRLSQPVLTIEEVTQRFNVTSKTIQRWRRRGLSARRFIFPDGKRRVGFLLSIVERFLAVHRDQVVHSANFSEISSDEQAEILRRARRLAIDGQCWPDEIFRRIARGLNRAPLTIAHVIKTHGQAILAQAAAAPIDEERIRIAREYRHGTSLASLAKEFNRPKSAVYRVIFEERLARLCRRKAKFIDDPLYHQDDASEVIDGILAQDELPAQAEPTRIPRDLPAYLQDLYRTPLLTPARERSLFLKLNFHKFQFVMARRRLEPQFAQLRDLKTLEHFRRNIVETRNQIIRANLRLVVSVARKHLRPTLSLMELISEGNLTVIRAIDSFDLHKGNRFSTYATLALMKGFARGVPAMQAAARLASGNEAMLGALADGRNTGDLRDLVQRDQVHELLKQLDGREREVISAHFGLRNSEPATYQQVGTRLGLSKQRVRQIEQAALAKLRAAGGD